MHFDEKVRENVEAVERLLPDDAGEHDALNNAAASRAYYAAYLAVVDRALRQGRSFTGMKHGYFRHDSLPSDAVIWHILDEDTSEDLAWLRDLRIKADYLEDIVLLEEASQALEVARTLVNRTSKER
jgi:uncharacterized protein (UPF0332 family)